MDEVFRALADPTRRSLLDELFREDGQTLGALEQRLPMTRFGVMKHLKVLEAAGLVVTRRRGREKLHFLNPVPIRLVHDRWVSKYSEPWAAALSGLKSRIEGTGMEKVFEIYIKTTPERLWEAITDGELRAIYTFGVGVVSDWTQGSRYEGIHPGSPGPINEGENLEVDPPRRLVQSFRALWSDDVRAQGTSRVTYEIEPVGDSCRLCVTHDELAEGANPQLYGGWPMILSGLKTLLACILGSSTVFLDGTVVNVALPAIRADLNGGLATQEWIVDAYLLTLGSLLLVGGSLGDILGRRRVFAAGVAGFGAASLLCAVSPSAGLLIAARALQGVAGAALVPSTLALLMDTFGEDQRAAAIGAWTAWTGIATAGGPLAAGLLIQLGSWRWIFVVNLPLVLATLRLLAHAPRGERRTGGRVDWPGALLCALGLGGPVFALIEQPRHGWGASLVWAPLVGGIALLAAFLVWEGASRSPMLPLAMFRARNFAVGNVATLLFYGALSTLSFFLVVFLQQVAGYSPLDAGLALMPMSIVTFALAKRFGALADRIGPRLFMGVGPLVAGAGVLALLRVDAHADYVRQLLPAVTVFSLGLAMTVAPLTAAVLGAVASGHSGVASGVNNAIARVAGLVAIAAVGAVVAGHFATGVDSRLHTSAAAATSPVRNARERPFVIDASAFPVSERPTVRAALVSSSLDSYRLAIAISGALAILSGLLSLVGISNRKRAVAAADCAGGAFVGASTDVAARSLAPAAPVQS